MGLSKSDSGMYYGTLYLTPASKISADGSSFSGNLSSDSGTVQEVLNDIDGLQLGDENRNGFDRQDIASQGEISWVDATRTLSISPVGLVPYSFYSAGELISLSTQESVVIPDVTGTYYVYFDTSGVLMAIEQSVLIPDVFYKFCIVALVYWNSASGEGLYGDERHGYRMSSSTHAYNHNTFGARLGNGGGFDPNGLANGVPTFTSIDSGSIWDEDILHSISSAADVPWIYRLDTTGDWTLAPSDNQVSLNVGGTYSVWNEFTGTTWQLTEGTPTNDFFITFFVATGFEYPAELYKIPSQGAYSTRNAARDAIESEKSRLQIEGLPSAEIVFLYATIVDRTGDLVALADGSEFYDLRGTSGAGGSSGNSSTLSADISNSVTNFTGVLSVADTNVQLALDTLDDHVIDSHDTTATGAELTELTDGSETVLHFPRSHPAYRP